MSAVAKIVAALTDPCAEKLSDGLAVLAAFVLGVALTAVFVALVS